MPETIVATATPAGRGAVSVIRVSGSDVPRVALEVLGSLPAPRRARVGSFLDADGSPLDQGIALYFPAPASFTGEHVLELQGHGGTLVTDLVVRRLLELGCRMARAGEFSERAFLNGKMDVAQAEAVADLIGAGTHAAARAAVRSMQGEFSARIHALQSLLTALRVQVEAAIDFADEELELLPTSGVAARLSTALATLDSIKSAARQGALLREGLNIVIAGKPNAGKSSLLNCLVGDEVAIVTEVPGTTRDALRYHIQMGGLQLNVTDTAGLRATQDTVEAEGVRRARLEIERADRVLYVIDAGAGEFGLTSAERVELPPQVPLTCVINKIDLAGIAAHVDEIDGMARLFVSARSGEGLQLLRTHLQASAGLQEGAGVFSARRRHLDALGRAESLLRAAAESLAGVLAWELFAEDLRLAQQALGEITGEFGSDDLLGAIFSSFCIGK